MIRERFPPSGGGSEEFQRDAVQLVTDEKYTFKAAATAIGVTEQTVRAWHA